jgi:hypothetical protein
MASVDAAAVPRWASNHDVCVVAFGQPDLPDPSVLTSDVLLAAIPYPTSTSPSKYAGQWVRSPG